MICGLRKRQRQTDIIQRSGKGPWAGSLPHIYTLFRWAFGAIPRKTGGWLQLFTCLYAMRCLLLPLAEGNCRLLLFVARFLVEHAALLQIREPLDDFFDVTIKNAVPVIVGEHIGKILMQVFSF